MSTTLSCLIFRRRRPSTCIVPAALAALVDRELWERGSGRICWLDVFTASLISLSGTVTSLVGASERGRAHILASAVQRGRPLRGLFEPDMESAGKKKKKPAKASFGDAPFPKR